MGWPFNVTVTPARGANRTCSPSRMKLPAAAAVDFGSTMSFDAALPIVLLPGLSANSPASPTYSRR